MAHLMPYMIVAAGFYQAGDVVSSHLMRNIQPNVMMVIKMFSSVFCLVSNFIAAYFFGLFGVVVSMILFGLVYFLCFSCYSFSKRDNGLSPASS
jgi:O-antigen/teichoic acid export membrane protein